jgi:tetratricopeptide (TPR) repeat protein
MPRQKSTHVDDPRAVGERLRVAREAAGLSQRRLAFTGCSPAYISRIESGDRIPSLQLLRELGRRLGVSEDYLATGSDPQKRDTQLLEAEVALRLGELELAESLYTIMLEESSGNAERAVARAGFGQIAFRQGDPRVAIDHFEAAIELSGSETLDPDVADSLGRAYAMVGELDSAIGVFERGLEDAEGDDDVFRAAQFLVLLGHALIGAGKVGRAEELLGRALAIGMDFQSPGVRARLYWTQSRRYAERDEPEPAGRFARAALEVLRMNEDTYRTGRARRLLAHIEVDRGRAEEALGMLEEGRPLLESAGNLVEGAQYRLEEARALAKLGRKEEAAALALQISEIIADAHPEDAARSYATLAEVYEEIEDRARARELTELATDLLRTKKTVGLREAAGKPAP